MPSSAPKNKTKTHDAWVVYMDIYGFKNLIKSKNMDSIFKSMSAAIESTLKIVKTGNNKSHIHFLSDCLFLIYITTNGKSKGEQFQRCIEDTQEILAEFSKNNLALRGSISFGSIIYKGNTLIGPAVVSSVENESLVSAPLVVLPAKYLDSNCNIMGVKDYPTKNGIMRMKIILPHPIDDFYNLVRKNCSHYVLQGPDHVAKAWYDALTYIENVNIFGEI